jgi:prepilin-type N-terminal cleavage/methylation domain-containing protein
VKRRSKHNCKGFSLIEVLLVSLLLAIIVGVVSMAFVETLQTSSVASARLRMQQNLRDTLGYMSRIIRFAGVRPVDTAIEEIDESYIVFQGDYDADGATDRFSFAYDSPNKTITVTHWEKVGANYYLVNDPEIVMTNVDDLVFTFYTENNTVTTDPDLVTAVMVQVTLSPPASVRHGIREMVGSLSSSQRVYCPNLAWRLAG